MQCRGDLTGVYKVPLLPCPKCPSYHHFWWVLRFFFGLWHLWHWVYYGLLHYDTLCGFNMLEKTSWERDQIICINVLPVFQFCGGDPVLGADHVMLQSHSTTLENIEKHLDIPWHVWTVYFFHKSFEVSAQYPAVCFQHRQSLHLTMEESLMVSFRVNQFSDQCQLPNNSKSRWTQWPFKGCSLGQKSATEPGHGPKGNWRCFFRPTLDGV